MPLLLITFDNVSFTCLWLSILGTPARIVFPVISSGAYSFMGLNLIYSGTALRVSSLK